MVSCFACFIKGRVVCMVGFRVNGRAVITFGSTVRFVSILWVVVSGFHWQGSA